MSSRRPSVCFDSSAPRSLSLGSSPGTDMRASSAKSRSPRKLNQLPTSLPVVAKRLTSTGDNLPTRRVTIHSGEPRPRAPEAATPNRLASSLPCWPRAPGPVRALRLRGAGPTHGVTSRVAAPTKRSARRARGSSGRTDRRAARWWW